MSVSIHGTGTIIGIDQGIQISGVSTFSNNVSIGGTLTYEDVTNVDSIGIITARSGINAEGGSITSKNYIFGAISTTISDTATDIFVYDTSKDSDGGAWRKRTTNTSWYNETLGTATRGTRQEFPSVAVIVVVTSLDYFLDLQHLTIVGFAERRGAPSLLGVDEYVDVEPGSSSKPSLTRNKYRETMLRPPTGQFVYM